MVDDIQLGYYDSNVRKIIYRQYRSEHVQEEQEDGRNIFGGQHRTMKRRGLLSSQKLNSTHGMHVQQRLVGCELLDNGTAGPLRSVDAFNGVTEEALRYTIEQNTIQVESVWSATWSYFERNQIEWMYANIYHPICIKTLKNYLHTRRNHVMRKVKPRVRLLQQALKDSRGAKVTCLATGFYPRHLNLTLLRDGQPVPDHQITGGELLPNADETYQMRKSLEVSAEELQQHHYTCTAEHLSLDNKLDFGLEYEPGEALMPIAASLLVLLVVFVVGGTAGFILWKRRLRGDNTSSLSSYRATSSTEEEETTTGSTS
ncbi:hypothetical protein ACEWY4_011963 [Coilia grayii]|uniref:Ig-like domain-containing protein n=1 Tax=Coilia grayii TaxID=363190 RepID=A0ABD1JZ65_9TELE